MIDFVTKRFGEIAERASALGAEIDTLLANEGLTEEQATRFAALEEEAGELATERAELQRRLDARNAVAALAKNPANVAPGGPAGPDPVINRVGDPYDLGEIRAFGTVPVAQELRNRAYKAIEQERALTDAQKEGVVRTLETIRDPEGRFAAHVLATGHPDYRTAWSKLMAGKGSALNDAEQRALARAMSLTGSAGGYMIPYTLDPSVILTNAGIIEPIRQISRVEQIVTDVWHGVTSAGVTASWDGEAAEVSDDAPTLASPSVTPYKAQAFVPFSIEAGMDIANLAPAVAELFADAKARLEGAAFATGSGSSQPKGIVTAVIAVTTSRVAATTNNTFGLVDVYNTYDAVPARHIPGASWIANGAIYNKIRQFDTAGGAGLWERLPAGMPTQLLGKPAYECSTMDGSLGAGNDDCLLIGDFRKFLIVDRIGLSVEYIPHLFGATNSRPTGQRGWYAYWRVGADALDTGAFRCLRV
jgi:HK97 family phage major capsid protein